ncbi:MAG: hypothetical protein ACYTBJ_15860 [Planctomycetota bacterium]
MMEQWLRIRQRVLREGVSRRQILKETGMHWTTLERVLSNPTPPGYCRSKPTYSKIDPYRQRIREILQQDGFVPKKQRHTAHRIWRICWRVIRRTAMLLNRATLIGVAQDGRREVLK